MSKGFQVGKHRGLFDCIRCMPSLLAMLYQLCGLRYRRFLPGMKFKGLPSAIGKMPLLVKVYFFCFLYLIIRV